MVSDRKLYVILADLNGPMEGDIVLGEYPLFAMVTLVL